MLLVFLGVINSTDFKDSSFVVNKISGLEFERKQRSFKLFRVGIASGLIKSSVETVSSISNDLDGLNAAFVINIKEFDEIASESEFRFEELEIITLSSKFKFEELSDDDDDNEFKGAFENVILSDVVWVGDGGSIDGCRFILLNFTNWKFFKKSKLDSKSGILIAFLKSELD